MGLVIRETCPYTVQVALAADRMGPLREDESADSTSNCH